MRLTIESTDVLTELDSVKVRLWEGRTESGIPCKVFIHRVVVANAVDQTQFEQELREQVPPGRVVPLRLVL